MSARVQKYVHKIVEQFISEVTHESSGLWSVHTRSRVVVRVLVNAHGLFLFALPVNTWIENIRGVILTHGSAGSLPHDFSHMRLCGINTAVTEASTNAN